MEILINELSLDGQFKTIDDFFDSLPQMIKMQKLIEESDNIILIRHYELYNRSVTPDKTLHEIMIENGSRTSNEFRVFKRLLRKLMSDDPFWSSSPLHSLDDCYVCEISDEIPENGHSLAEACERDKVVISFDHINYKKDSIEIEKNGTPIVLYNITNQVQLSELLYEKLLISPLSFSRHRFDHNKLSFDLLDNKYGYEILQLEEIKAFISSFKSFHELSWEEIGRNDGLQYKAYSPPSKEGDWFRQSSYKDKKIYKFRTSSKYRCFGFREENTFYVLRFETDHSQSDKG